MPAYIVDYFSFSIPTPRLLAQWDMSHEQSIPFDVDERSGGIAWLLASQTNYFEIGRNSVFDRGFRFPDIGCTYYDGHKSNVSLVQFSGAGCAWMRETGNEQLLLNDWHNRCTRLDIALDIECDDTPEDFVYRASNNRFKVTQHFETQSGATWYRGSRDSDRYARVYRYNAPHPRHRHLRIEYQLSDEQAKLAAKMCVDEGTDSVGDKLGVLFGWTSPCFLQSASAQKLPSSPRSETRGNTVFWLHKQVLPALRKSAEKGDLETLIAFERSVRAIIDEYEEKRS